MGGDNFDLARHSPKPDCIARFVGYFWKSLHKSPPIPSPKSYAQAVKSPSSKMSDRDQGRRDGFGAGRFGRGTGQTGSRGNVWQCVQGRGDGGGDPANMGDERGDSRYQRSYGSGFPDGDRGDRDGRGNSRSGMNDHAGGGHSSFNWDREADHSSRKHEEHDLHQEGHKMGNDELQSRDKEQTSADRDTSMKQQDDLNTSRQSGRHGCAVCGLKNHNTDECRRKEFCEMCGFANHSTLDCKREPLWNMGPELCAAQVPDQSFFHIDEHIDVKTSRE